MQLFFSLVLNHVMISSTLQFTTNRPCSNTGENSQGHRCIQQCGSDYYRENLSLPLSFCRKCGTFSSSQNTNGTRCECRHGFLRRYSEKYVSSAHCHSLKPSNVTVMLTSSDTLLVKWKKLPYGLVSGERVGYIVHCTVVLKEGSVRFTKVTKKNKVKFRGMKADTKYTFTIQPDHTSFKLYNPSILSTSIDFTINSEDHTRESVIARVEKFNKASLGRFLWDFVPPVLALIVISLMVVFMFKSRHRRRYVHNKYRIVKEQIGDGRRGNQPTLTKQG